MSTHVSGDAERIILGAILVQPLTLASAAAELRPGDFGVAAHRFVFEAMLALADDGRPVDLVTVVDELRRCEKLEAAGGPAGVSALMDGIPRLKNVDEWARIVRDKALLRGIATAAARIRGLALEDDAEGATTLDAAFGDLMALAERTAEGGFRDPNEDLRDAMAHLDSLALDSMALGLRTGLTDLDAKLGGLQRGDLVIVGARPSHGKSTLAVNIAEVVAATSAPVAFFSMEMTRDQLAARRLCAAAEVGVDDLRGNPESPAYPRLVAAWGKLKDRPLLIDDTFDTTVSQIRAKARRVKHERGALGLVVVDYLQLIRGDERAESRQQEVSKISRSLKGMAKDLDVPVLALSQLNRSVGQSRPTMDTLRESGALEQDADIVLLLHRPEEDTPTAENAGIAEIIVAKHRKGPTGTVRCYFQKWATRFANLSDAVVTV